ncbi:membrane protein insertion efficiency factor YidD [Candidatus Omnitrophota bacterium]
MLRRAALTLLDFYQQHIRRILPVSCRFEPSCSEYTKQAILKYGFCRGALKASARIISCHPFSGRCGYDPLR